MSNRELTSAKSRKGLLLHFMRVHPFYRHLEVLNLSSFIQIYTFFIIKGFGTIVFISMVISTTVRPICPPVFFRCLWNSGTFTELQTMSFIESTGVTCSDSKLRLRNFDKRYKCVF